MLQSFLRTYSQVLATVLTGVNSVQLPSYEDARIDFQINISRSVRINNVASNGRIWTS
jgi:hypothetical protein